jgi:outer membrane protein assembly factor BamD
MSNTFFLTAFVKEPLSGTTTSAPHRRKARQNRRGGGPGIGGYSGGSGRKLRLAPRISVALQPGKLLVSAAMGFLLCFFLLIIAAGCGPKRASMILDADDQFALAIREFEAEHYDQAIIEFQKLAFNYPGAIFIDSAQYLLGMCYFNQTEYPLAALEFNKLISSFPTSGLSDDAAFMAAFCDFKMSSRPELDQKNTEQAIQELQNFLDDYPTSDRAKEAQDLLRESRSKLAQKAYKTGCLYLKMRKYEAALIYLRYVLNEYHDTEWTASAQFEIAEAYYNQKKYEEAREEYEKFLETFPQDKLAKKAQQRLDKLSSEAGHAEK